jgi:hypothetical protein
MNRLAGLTLVTLFIFAGVAAVNSFSVDENPSGLGTMGHHGDGLILDEWSIQYSFDLTAATGAGGNAGSEFNGTYFYSTRPASNLIHELDLAGNLVKEFFIPGVSGLCDLAWNGTYMYGGDGGGVIWEMDFSAEALISSIYGEFESRAIAYNDDDDQFYCSNWGDPVWTLDASTGFIAGTFNLGVTTTTFGMAYESQCSGDPTLWVFDQTDGGAVIHQWDLGSGSFTGVTHDVNTDFANSGIAGGLWFSEAVEPGTGTLGGVSQGEPDMAFAYELCPVEEGLVIEIQSINGLYFRAGDTINHPATVHNNTNSPIPIIAEVYATDQVNWEFTLHGPFSFNIPANTTIGPVNLSSRIPPGAPPMNAYICAEANEKNDCFEVRVFEGECPSIVDVWTLTYDWNCDGEDGSTSLTFYENGTFQSSGGSSGTWEQAGCVVNWWYESGTHYWGVMQSDGLFMEGDMLSWMGSDGCWWAERTIARALPPGDDQSFSDSGELLMTN